MIYNMNSKGIKGQPEGGQGASGGGGQRARTAKEPGWPGAWGGQELGVARGLGWPGSQSIKR